MIHRKNKKILFFSTWSAFFLLLEPSGIFAWWFQEEGGKGGGGNCRLVPPSSFAWVVLLPPLPANLFFCEWLFSCACLFLRIVRRRLFPLRSGPLKCFIAPERHEEGGGGNVIVFSLIFRVGGRYTIGRKVARLLNPRQRRNRQMESSSKLEIQNSEFDNLLHPHLPRH